MSDNPKEAESEMEKAIFIPGDCWLEVFDFLAPSQLGLEIAVISRRFDCFVDEHFKTRRWALENKIQIGAEFGENGTKQMKIVNSDGKALPIPQNPLPNKVIGFGWISIYYFNQNVLTFLRSFQRFFSVCTTKKLIIDTENVHISEFIVLNIWPMFKDTIRLVSINSIAFRRMRQLVPLLLNDCPSLLYVFFDDGIFPEFPPDDSANASDGQAVAKWLFTPRPDNFRKVLKCYVKTAADQWASTVEQIKAAFSSASSPVSFVISVQFSTSSPIDSVLPFDLINEFTGEILALTKNEHSFTFIRFKIGAATSDDEEQFYNLTDGGRKKKIEICIGDGGVDDGLLNAASSAGPNGDH